ncbi:hypothetical protein Tco_0476711 [Tanacetum coccineum]
MPRILIPLRPILGVLHNDFLAFTAVDMSAVGPEEQILNQPDNIPDDVDTENQDEETATMIEEPASGMLIFPTVLMANC